MDVRKSKRSSRLANKDKLEIFGFCDTLLTIQNKFYAVKLAVVKCLICDLIICLDVIYQQSTVSLPFGAKKDKFDFSVRAATLSEPVCSFPKLNIEPLVIFDDFVYSARPITTKCRWCKPADQEFMKSEVARILKEEIIEPFTKSCIARSFVHHGHKDRMVMDYSKKLIMLMDVDAYPFPEMEILLDKATNYHYFSKIDLRTACHQVPLKGGDRNYTDFKVNVKFYQFTRLPFGLTNAVPFFQPTMDDFVEKHSFTGAHPILDDVIVGGRTKGEHERKLKKFLDAVKADRLTLNLKKVLSWPVAMLGHIISAGSKPPDPDRFQTLESFPIPEEQKALKRLISFFA